MWRGNLIDKNTRHTQTRLGTLADYNTTQHNTTAEFKRKLQNIPFCI